MESLTIEAGNTPLFTTFLKLCILLMARNHLSKKVHIAYFQNFYGTLVIGTGNLLFLDKVSDS